MKRPLFVSIDGPKGTGKSSIIQGVNEALRKNYSLQLLVEKELDPYREKSKELLLNYKGKMTKEVETQVLNWMAKGRFEIGQQYLEHAQADIVFIDRWYPSDVVFRRYHLFDECLLINELNNVRKPDLVIATVCDPKISLRRAKTRHDGLRSLVIDDLQDQLESTNRFHQAAIQQSWYILQTEGPLDGIVANVVTKMKELLKS